METKKNLSKLVKKTAAAKPIVTPVEINDEENKAIQSTTINESVNSLLSDIKELTSSKSTDLITKNEDVSKKNIISGEQREATNWLEEQITRLTEENDELRTTLEMYSNPREIHSETETSASVINLFNELQGNLINMGVNEQTNQPNLIIYPIPFLMRMIEFFPFLRTEKRF